MRIKAEWNKLRIKAEWNELKITGMVEIENKECGMN